MKLEYLLRYLKEEWFIEPVPGTKVEMIEEYVNQIPIGYRLRLNGKESDIVVWYADYGKWIEQKMKNIWEADVH
jgi:hypothetical protein